jgi:hypothetical protein
MNKQLLQQARLITGLHGLQTPLAPPVAVAVARLGTVFVIPPTEGVAHFRLKPLLDDQRRRRCTNLLGLDSYDNGPRSNHEDSQAASAAAAGLQKGQVLRERVQAY